MTNNLNNNILQAVQQGIIDAQKDYYKSFQSDLSSEYAPEYLMTVYIFRSLLSLIDGYGVALEVPISDLDSGYSYKRFQGRKPGSVRYNGKCDLVLLDSKEKAKAVIEVKRNPWFYDEDMDRLISLLDLNIEMSIFASCMYKKSKKELIEESDLLLKTIKKDYQRNITIELSPIPKRVLKYDGEWVWYPIVFLVRKQ